MLEELILQNGTGDSWLALLFLGGWLLLEGGSRVREFLEDDGDQEDGDDDLDRLRAEYVAGEISIEEYENKVELILDEDASELRDELERVDGIGSEISAEIAQSIGSVDALEDASREDLEAIDHVGPSRADRILDRD